MNEDEFRKSPSGRLVPTVDGCGAFVPHPLPPPKLDLARLADALSEASLALGKLDGLGNALPHPVVLVRSFSRVEAIASSKIEGTVTSMPELLALEIDPNAQRVRNDTREVRNYSRALEKGLEIITSLPISNRLFRELHGILMDGVRDERGMQVIPGEFKTKQNWIGGRLIKNARFVPPPPTEAITSLAELERFINDPSPTLPLLIRLALVHYQFETIHPFPDGNGRVGRLVIPMMLCEQKVMSHALLYLSAYFERHNDEYIDRLFEVSRTGKWEEWIEFFLRAVTFAAKSGVKKALALQELRKKYMDKVQSARSSGWLAKLIDDLFAIPAITIPYAQVKLGISYNAAKANIQRLVDLGILVPSTNQKEKPLWFYGFGILAVS